MSFCLPAIFLISLYFMLRFEIGRGFNSWYTASISSKNGSYLLSGNIAILKDVWILNYSLLFMIVLAFFNLKKLKSDALGSLNLILNGIGIVMFLIIGLGAFSQLQTYYLNGVGTDNTTIWSTIGVRYLCVYLLNWCDVHKLQVHFVAIYRMERP